jgi:hypothetical protein
MRNLARQAEIYKIAKVALQGILSSPGYTPEAAAKRAVECADALLLELEKQKP